MSDLTTQKVPEGYKQTEVGIIPEDWGVISIKTVCKEIFLGLTSKVDYVNFGGIPLVRATDIATGFLSFDNARTISVEQHQKLTKYRIAKRGDVLVSKSGSLGVCALVGSDDEFSIYESIIVLQPSSKLDSLFLLCLLRYDETQSRMIGGKVGSGVAHLNIEMFRNLDMPIPPSLKEQKKIGQVVSDVDALITSLEKLITKKRAIKTAAMQQLLTGKKRLPPFDKTHAGYKQTELGEIPEDWGVGVIGNSTELITKGTTPMTIGRSFVQSGITFIKVESVGEHGMFDISKFTYIDDITDRLMARSRINEGDLLISIAGALGRAIIATKDILPANTNQALAIVRFKVSGKLTASFVYHYTKSILFTKHIDATRSQGAQPNLSLRDIADFPIIIPGEQEQAAITIVLSNIDAELEALEQRLTKTQQLKQGMMQELLTGRTRLV